jgi:UDP-N-acetylmuramate dehydrogenase
LSNEECNFGYRKSIFKTELKDRFIITHIVFKLKKISQHYDFNTQYADIQKAFSEQ